MKKYKSKIGVGIVLFVAVVLGSTSVAMIVNHVWSGVIINLVVAGFLAYVFLSTYYVVNGNDLVVKCGFLFKKTIKIDTIIKIIETNNPISSPAASLDRIAIYYQKSGSVIISPKDKMGFINQLTMLNDKIEVVLKKGNQN